MNEILDVAKRIAASLSISVFVYEIEDTAGRFHVIRFSPITKTVTTRSKLVANFTPRTPSTTH